MRNAAYRMKTNPNQVLGWWLVPALLLAATRIAAQPCEVPSFRPPLRYPVTALSAVVVADLDGDRRPEILTSGNHIRQLDTFSVLRNRGNGAFEPEQRIAAGFGDRLEGVADWSGDGSPDLVATNYWANGIALTRGAGALQFGARAPYDTATHGGPTRMVDYDRDGVQDLVSFSYGSANPVRVHRFRGLGDGTFESRQTTDTTLTVAASPSIRIRDGAVEMLTGNHSGQLAIFRIASEGVSWSTLSAGPGSDTSHVFADVNEDGVADIIHITDGDGAQDNPHEFIFITLGRADGTFLDRRQLAHPRQISFPSGVQAADLDGDGHRDLIVSDFRLPTLRIFRGDSHGNFVPGIPIDAAAPVNDFAIADLNGDGRVDLVTVNDDGTVSVLGNRSCARSRRRAARP